MNSKLAIITALASVAFTGLPLQAQTTQMKNRTEIISSLAAAQCHINAGNITEERANEIMNEIVQERPHLKNAYLWALNSDNARAAVEGMTPTIGAECNSEITDEVVINVLLPNLN